MVKTLSYTLGPAATRTFNASLAGLSSHGFGSCRQPMSV